MFKRTRYQEGSLAKETRQRNADVWVYRWREVAPDGSIKRRKIIVGTVKEYVSEAHARRQLASLKLNINENPSQGEHPALMTMGQLIRHYKEYELGGDCTKKGVSTIEVYMGYLDCRILPRWEKTRLLAVTPVEVESWLRSLTLADGGDLADGTKAKIRSVMSDLFQHARRYQLIANNPIRGLVRQSSKRRREPDILTPKEIACIVSSLSTTYQCMVLLLSTTGLRFSELRGLKWGDVDFDKGILDLRRGVVRKNITELKTEASRKPVPIDTTLMHALTKLRITNPYNQPEDWVFASIRKKGKVPIWPSSLMSDYVKPAAKVAGITKHVTWHVFRHSFATLLKGNGEDIKTVQESLRHANPGLTMKTYVQAIPADVRSAHERVVEQVMSNIAAGAIGPVMDLELLPSAASY